MSSTATDTSTTATTTKRKIPPKKSVSDRSAEEFQSLVRDIINAVAEAGPRAGPARTIQAYVALTRTLQDFLPPAIRNSPIFLPADLLQRGATGRRRSRSKSNPEKKTEAKEAEKFSAPVALRKLFERLGATYIKLGQFIASSPTIFPSEYVLEFQKCLDQTETLDWDVIKGVIEGELGDRKIETVFKNVDPEPLASASIAQVHRATLKTGESVVIKVQKPRIDESLKADLSFIYVASRVLEFLQPDFERTSLSAIAGDVRSSMLEELDFEKEAGNVEDFRDFLRDEGLVEIATAPRIYREFTTKKIMTMEFLDGVSMLDVDSISKITNSNPETTILRALNVWTTSVTTMPFFHADVHAGNLLVLPDGRVGFIDFGIVGRVGDKVFAAVSDLSGALAAGDYRGMAEALCNMGAADEKVDLDSFGADIEKALNKLNSVQPDVTVTANMDNGSVQGTLDFDENEVTGLLLDFVDVAENNGLKLPREFGLLVKQSLYFDRYLKILAPNIDGMYDSAIGDVTTMSSARTLPPTDGSDVLIDV